LELILSSAMNLASYASLPRD